MARIYEIAQDYRYLQEMAENDEVDQQMVTDTLEAVDGEFEYKAESCAKVTKNLEGYIPAINTEIERLMKRRKTIENNIKCIKKALQEAMELTGKTKFKTELFSFGIQKNAPSVVIDAADIRDIPEDYLKFKEPEVDKTAIKNAINAGVDFEGLAHLEVSQSLRIR